jgi:hypothetical protein
MNTHKISVYQYDGYIKGVDLGGALTCVGEFIPKCWLENLKGDLGVNGRLILTLEKQGTECESKDCIGLTQENIQWHATLNTVTKFGLHKSG